MTNLILDFPVLQADSGDFVDGVSYRASAKRKGKVLLITHTLKGKSFVRRLVEAGKASFSSLLLYRNSAEREQHSCDSCQATDDALVATQSVPLSFSYAPQIAASIVLHEEQQISVGETTGLIDFWPRGSRFAIPSFARIAIARKLSFTGAGLLSLMEIKLDEKLGDCEMEVRVNEIADEGEVPVTLICGKLVHYQLNRATDSPPSSEVDVLRHAIVTQALCAVYAYMHNFVLGENADQDSEYEPRGVLAAHFQKVHENTGMQLGGENFNPSLAATKMQPYALHVINRADSHD